MSRVVTLTINRHWTFPPRAVAGRLAKIAKVKGAKLLLDCSRSALEKAVAGRLMDPIELT
ncbi:MAG TPA: hypothetical protein VG889_01815 [Rhizomicrobium sp.]|nr:hypothetical protein [Rhizomicrobium sp.]